MKPLKPEQKRLAVLLGILVVVLVWYGLRLLGGGGLVTGRTRGSDLDWRSHNLPQLRTAERGVETAEDAEAGRNPFVFGPRPTPTPNLTPRPTPKPRPTRPPAPPRPTPTPTPEGWVRPPKFTAEYIGQFGPTKKRVAVFREKVDDRKRIFVCLEGGTLQDASGNEVFIVREIGLESVVVGFVGFPEKERTRVPLAKE